MGGIDLLAIATPSAATGSRPAAACGNGDRSDAQLLDVLGSFQGTSSNQTTFGDSTLETHGTDHSVTRLEPWKFRRRRKGDVRGVVNVADRGHTSPHVRERGDSWMKQAPSSNMLHMMHHVATGLGSDVRVIRPVKEGKGGDQKVGSEHPADGQSDEVVVSAVEDVYRAMRHLARLLPCGDSINVDEYKRLWCEDGVVTSGEKTLGGAEHPIGANPSPVVGRGMAGSPVGASDSVLLFRRLTYLAVALERLRAAQVAFSVSHAVCMATDTAATTSHGEGAAKRVAAPPAVRLGYAERRSMLEVLVAFLLHSQWKLSGTGGSGGGNSRGEGIGKEAIGTVEASPAVGRLLGRCIALVGLVTRVKCIFTALNACIEAVSSGLTSSSMRFFWKDESGICRSMMALFVSFRIVGQDAMACSSYRDELWNASLQVLSSSNFASKYPVHREAILRELTVFLSVYFERGLLAECSAVEASGGDGRVGAGEVGGGSEASSQSDVNSGNGKGSDGSGSGSSGSVGGTGGNGGGSSGTGSGSASGTSQATPVRRPKLAPFHASVIKRVKSLLSEQLSVDTLMNMFVVVKVIGSSVLNAVEKAVCQRGYRQYQLLATTTGGWLEGLHAAVSRAWMAAVGKGGVCTPASLTSPVLRTVLLNAGATIGTLLSCSVSIGLILDAAAGKRGGRTDARTSGVERDETDGGEGEGGMGTPDDGRPASDGATKVTDAGSRDARGLADATRVSKRLWAGNLVLALDVLGRMFQKSGSYSRMMEAGGTRVIVVEAFCALLQCFLVGRRRMCGPSGVTDIESSPIRRVVWTSSQAMSVIVMWVCHSVMFCKVSEAWSRVHAVRCAETMLDCYVELLEPGELRKLTRVLGGFLSSWRVASLAATSSANTENALDVAMVVLSRSFLASEYRKCLNPTKSFAAVMDASVSRWDDACSHIEATYSLRGSQTGKGGEKGQQGKNAKRVGRAALEIVKGLPRFLTANGLASCATASGVTSLSSRRPSTASTSDGFGLSIIDSTFLRGFNAVDSLGHGGHGLEWIMFLSTANPIGLYASTHPLLVASLYCVLSRILVRPHTAWHVEDLPFFVSLLSEGMVVGDSVPRGMVYPWYDSHGADLLPDRSAAWSRVWWRVRGYAVALGTAIPDAVPDLVATSFHSIKMVQAELRAAEAVGIDSGEAEDAYKVAVRELYGRSLVLEALLSCGKGKGHERSGGVERELTIADTVSMCSVASGNGRARQEYETDVSGATSRQEKTIQHQRVIAVDAAMADTILGTACALVQVYDAVCSVRGGRCLDPVASHGDDEQQDSAAIIVRACAAAVSDEMDNICSTCGKGDLWLGDTVAQQTTPAANEVKLSDIMGLAVGGDSCSEAVSVETPELENGEVAAGGAAKAGTSGTTGDSDEGRGHLGTTLESQIVLRACAGWHLLSGLIRCMGAEWWFGVPRRALTLFQAYDSVFLSNFFPSNKEIGAPGGAGTGGIRALPSRAIVEHSFAQLAVSGSALPSYLTVLTCAVHAARAFFVHVLSQNFVENIVLARQCGQGSSEGAASLSNAVKQVSVVAVDLVGRVVMEAACVSRVLYAMVYPALPSNKSLSDWGWIQGPSAKDLPFSFFFHIESCLRASVIRLVAEVCADRGAVGAPANGRAASEMQSLVDALANVHVYDGPVSSRIMRGPTVVAVIRLLVRYVTSPHLCRSGAIGAFPLPGGMHLGSPGSARPLDTRHGFSTSGVVNLSDFAVAVPESESMNMAGVSGGRMDSSGTAGMLFVPGDGTVPLTVSGVTASWHVLSSKVLAGAVSVTGEGLGPKSALAGSDQVPCCLPRLLSTANDSGLLASVSAHVATRRTVNSLRDVCIGNGLCIPSWPCEPVAERFCSTDESTLTATNACAVLSASLLGLLYPALSSKVRGLVHDTVVALRDAAAGGNSQAARMSRCACFCLAGYVTLFAARALRYLESDVVKGSDKRCRTLLPASDVKDKHEAKKLLLIAGSLVGVDGTNDKSDLTVHVRRLCNLAASSLLRLGWVPGEVRRKMILPLIGTSAHGTAVCSLIATAFVGCALSYQAVSRRSSAVSPSLDGGNQRPDVRRFSGLCEESALKDPTEDSNLQLACMNELIHRGHLVRDALVPKNAGKAASGSRSSSSSGAGKWALKGDADILCTMACEVLGALAYCVTVSAASCVPFVPAILTLCADLRACSIAVVGGSAVVQALCRVVCSILREIPSTLEGLLGELMTSNGHQLSTPLSAIHRSFSPEIMQGRIDAAESILLILDSAWDAVYAETSLGSGRCCGSSSQLLESCVALTCAVVSGIMKSPSVCFLFGIRQTFVWTNSLWSVLLAWSDGTLELGRDVSRTCLCDCAAGLVDMLHFVGSALMLPSKIADDVVQCGVLGTWSQQLACIWVPRFIHVSQSADGACLSRVSGILHTGCDELIQRVVATCGVCGLWPILVHTLRQMAVNPDAGEQDAERCASTVHVLAEENFHQLLVSSQMRQRLRETFHSAADIDGFVFDSYDAKAKSDARDVNGAHASYRGTASDCAAMGAGMIASLLVGSPWSRDVTSAYAWSSFKGDLQDDDADMESDGSGASGGAEQLETVTFAEARSSVPWTAHASTRALALRLLCTLLDGIRKASEAAESGAVGCKLAASVDGEVMVLMQAAFRRQRRLRVLGQCRGTGAVTSPMDSFLHKHVLPSLIAGKSVASHGDHIVSDCDLMVLKKGARQNRRMRLLMLPSLSLMGAVVACARTGRLLSYDETGGKLIDMLSRVLYFGMHVDHVLQEAARFCSTRIALSRSILSAAPLATEAIVYLDQLVRTLGSGRNVDKHETIRLSSYLEQILSPLRDAVVLPGTVDSLVVVADPEDDHSQGVPTTQVLVDWRSQLSVDGRLPLVVDDVVTGLQLHVPVFLAALDALWSFLRVGFRARLPCVTGLVADGDMKCGYDKDSLVRIMDVLAKPVGILGHFALLATREEQMANDDMWKHLQRLRRVRVSPDTGVHLVRGAMQLIARVWCLADGSMPGHATMKATYSMELTHQEGLLVQASLLQSCYAPILGAALFYVGAVTSSVMTECVDTRLFDAKGAVYDTLRARALEAFPFLYQAANLQIAADMLTRDVSDIVLVSDCNEGPSCGVKCDDFVTYLYLMSVFLRHCRIRDVDGGASAIHLPLSFVESACVTIMASCGLFVPLLGLVVDRGLMHHTRMVEYLTVLMTSLSILLEARSHSSSSPIAAVTLEEYSTGKTRFPLLNGIRGVVLQIVDIVGGSVGDASIESRVELLKAFAQLQKGTATTLSVIVTSLGLKETCGTQHHEEKQVAGDCVVLTPLQFALKGLGGTMEAVCSAMLCVVARFSGSELSVEDGTNQATLRPGYQVVSMVVASLGAAVNSCSEQVGYLEGDGMRAFLEALCCIGSVNTFLWMNDGTTHPYGHGERSGVPSVFVMCTHAAAWCAHHAAAHGPTFVEYVPKIARLLKSNISWIEKVDGGAYGSFVRDVLYIVDVCLKGLALAMCVASMQHGDKTGTTGEQDVFYRWKACHSLLVELKWVDVGHEHTFGSEARQEKLAECSPGDIVQVLGSVRELAFMDLMGSKGTVSCSVVVEAMVADLRDILVADSSTMTVSAPILTALLGLKDDMRWLTDDGAGVEVCVLASRARHACSYRHPRVRGWR